MKQTSIEFLVERTSGAIDWSDPYFEKILEQAKAIDCEWKSNDATLQEEHKEAIEIINNDLQTPFRVDLLSHVSAKITKAYMKGFAEWCAKNYTKEDLVETISLGEGQWMDITYYNVFTTDELIELYLIEKQSQ